MCWATLGLGFEIHRLCNMLAVTITEFININFSSSVVPLCIWHVSVALAICGSLWMLGLTLISRIGRFTAQTSIATASRLNSPQNKALMASRHKPLNDPTNSPTTTRLP